MTDHIESFPSGAKEASDRPTAGTPLQDKGTKSSRARKRLFQGLVILFSLFLLVSFNLVYLMIVVSWLPDATYLAIIDDLEAADLVHRVHDSTLPVTAWTLLIGTALQLHRPQDRMAPLLMALAVPVALLSIQLVTGTFDPVFAGLSLVPLLLIALLHPRAQGLLRVRRLDGPMAVLTGVAAVAWIRFATTQAQFQRLALPGDTHAEMEHWSRMAAFALFVILWSVIGASDRPGWRLVAWVAGLGSAWYGLQSLLFPTAASAASVTLAVAAIAWGLAYIVMAERRARSGKPQHGEVAD